MEEKYNTNLASEFFVMSMLYRKGLDAYLTLGNKKGVDILIKKEDGTSLKIKVKGVNKRNGWPLSSGELSDSVDLFFILIGYEGKINDHNLQPKVWIIPAAIIKEKCKTSLMKSGKYLKYFSHRLVREEFSEYENNWESIEK